MQCILAKYFFGLQGERNGMANVLGASDVTEKDEQSRKELNEVCALGLENAQTR